MKPIGMRNTWITAMLVYGVVGLTGCGPLWRPQGVFDSWLDPSKTVHRPSETEMLPIGTTVGALDDYQEVFPNAEPPTVEDLQWSEAEYRLGPGDVINITVLDLPRVGLERTVQKTIEQSGYVDLPQLGERVRIGGLTIDEARDAIEDAYRPDILLEPEITITVLAQRQNVYHVLGAVARPGPYDIIRRKFHLLEALSRAGDVVQPNIRYVYVYRPTEAREQLQQAEEGMIGRDDVAPLQRVISDDPNDLPPLPGDTNGPAPTTGEAMEELRGAMPGPEPLPSTPQGGVESTPSTQDSINELEGLMNEQPSQVRPSMTHMSDFGGGVRAAATATVAQNGDGEMIWVFRNNEWVQAPAGQADQPAEDDAEPFVPAPPTAPQPREPVEPIGPRVPVAPQVGEPEAGEDQAWRPPTIPGRPLGQDDEDIYNWMEADLSHLARIIVIDLERLKQGDPSQNIVIRDGDVIHIPTLGRAEFYVEGEVNRPGVYDLTGRRVTVKQAVAAAGGLGPLAWPSNTMLIRRVGDGEELIVPLDLDLIGAGQEPDIYLKPDDLIRVGTHTAAPFLAVMRNAFRFTYGFGFIYDRNFAERNFGQFVEMDEFFRP